MSKQAKLLSIMFIVFLGVFLRRSLPQSDVVEPTKYVCERYVYEPIATPQTTARSLFLGW